MAKTLRIRQGETIDIEVKGNSTAQTVRFLVAVDGTTSPVIDKTAAFSGTIAIVRLEPPDTSIAVGTYVYELDVTYTDGALYKFPDLADCDGDDCTFPEFIVCEALD